MNIKQNEKIEMALNNISHYNDFKEYEKCNNIDKEEFKEFLELGNIQDITLGLYNGAIDTFTKRNITDNHIIDAIMTEIKGSDFYNYFDDEFIKENNIKTSNDWVLLYTEFYYVFTLDNSMYITEP